MGEFDSRITALLQPVADTFGFVAWKLDTGERILISDRESFPSASVIKVPLMVELFCLRDEGKLSLNEAVTLNDEDKVDGSGVLKELHGGLKLTLNDLTVLMIVTSDNTATNMLIHRIGMDSINKRMRDLDLRGTVLARKMYDWDAAKAGRENVCTPHDLAMLLVAMAEGRISSRCTSSEMVGIMARQQCREKIPLLLPEGTRIANKTGSLTDVTHDVGIVYGPTGPYVLCIFTKGVSDLVAAERSIAEASRLVYEYFCP